MTRISVPKRAGWGLWKLVLFIIYVPVLALLILFKLMGLFDGGNASAAVLALAGVVVTAAITE